MKAIFSIILVGSLLVSKVSAQNKPSEGEAQGKSFSIMAVTPPANQTGATNYTLSLSDLDFKSQKYVFYTDSNATVAYININGNKIRLTGGANPEHIFTYVSKGYTVTLSVAKGTPGAILSNSDD